MRTPYWLTLTAVLAVSCDRGVPLAERAVYRVKVDVVISGIPVDGFSSDALEHARTWSGSATAVSPDGDLLTARHLADVAIQSPLLCRGIDLVRHNSIILHSARVTELVLTVSGYDGRIWRGYAVGPIDGGPPCDAQGRLSLFWMATSQATIDAVDDATDLALIRINATDLPHLRLDAAPPVPGLPVISMGRYGDGHVVDEEGVVVQTCLMRSFESHIIPAMPVLRISQMIWRGMSGGPVASGNRLLGINAWVENWPPFDSYAVSNTYMAAWYDWVRGVSPVRPEPVCPQNSGGEK